MTDVDAGCNVPTGSVPGAWFIVLCSAPLEGPEACVGLCSFSLFALKDPGYAFCGLQRWDDWGYCGLWTCGFEDVLTPVVLVGSFGEDSGLGSGG